MSCRVVVLSRSWLVAESLAGMVAQWRGFDADCVAAPVDAALDLSGIPPHVVLVDGFDPEDARALTSMAAAAWPLAYPVVVGRGPMGQSGGPGALDGAVGWLGNDAGEEELREALEAGAARGRVETPGSGAVSPPGISFAGASFAGPSCASLTARELEVLGLLAAGHDAPAIARRLTLSPNTVRTHIQHILGKLGVHSRFEAATLALRSGAGKAAGDLPLTRSTDDRVPADDRMAVG